MLAKQQVRAEIAPDFVESGPTLAEVVLKVVDLGGCRASVSQIRAMSTNFGPESAKFVCCGRPRDKKFGPDSTKVLTKSGRIWSNTGQIWGDVGRARAKFDHIWARDIQRFDNFGRNRPKTDAGPKPTEAGPNSDERGRDAAPPGGGSIPWSAC